MRQRGNGRCRDPDTAHAFHALQATVPGHLGNRPLGESQQFRGLLGGEVVRGFVYAEEFVGHRNIRPIQRRQVCTHSA
jgi:hypothetical protein